MIAVRGKLAKGDISRLLDEPEDEYDRLKAALQMLMVMVKLTIGASPQTLR